MIKLRSLLFVPGDSEKKLEKAGTSGADALILDLEDSVAPVNKGAARVFVAAYLRARPRLQRQTQLWVRINPLDTSLALEDLCAIVGAAPDGVMLPKANGPGDAQRLSHYLDALEAQSEIGAAPIKILPVATETAIAPFNLGAYSSAGLTRLFGLTWGAEDLSAAMGASTNIDSSGGWALTYKLARSLTLLAAHAAGVQAIETLYTDFHDTEGLKSSCRAARAEGFTGRIAIHPAQVAVINESFTPSQDEIGHAKRIIAAFAEAPGAGVAVLDGKMIDAPHLKQAQSLLAQAAAYLTVSGFR